MMMSPIPEMNSSKGSITQASNTKTLDDDRKLTGTGQYNLDKYKLSEADVEEYYSDDFEEVEDEDDK